MNDEWRFINQGTIKDTLNAIINLANYSLLKANEYGYISGSPGNYPYAFAFKPQHQELFETDIEDIKTYTHEVVVETNYLIEYKPLFSEEVVEDRDVKLYYKYVYTGVTILAGGSYKRTLILAIQQKDNFYSIFSITDSGMEYIKDGDIEEGKATTQTKKDWEILFGRYFEAEFDMNPPDNLRLYAETYLNQLGSHISIDYIRYSDKIYYAIASYEDINKIIIYKITEQADDIITANYSNSDNIKDAFRHIAEITNRILKFEYDGSMKYQSRDVDESDINIDRGSIVDINIENLDFESVDFTLSNNIIITQAAKEIIENKQKRLISGLREKQVIGIIENWSQIDASGNLVYSGGQDPKSLLFQSMKVNGIFEKSLIKRVDINEDTLIFTGERIV